MVLLNPIGKPRDDANLRWLGEINDIQLYTAKVNSVRFKRNLRIVLLKKSHQNKVIVLFTTDYSLDAKDIIRFYKARFQIEFLFRDAKQHLGLNHCQACHAQALHCHFNLSMTGLNLLKLEAREHQINTQKQNTTVISIASWKIRKANEHLLKRFSA